MVSGRRVCDGTPSQHDMSFDCIGTSRRQRRVCGSSASRKCRWDQAWGSFLFCAAGDSTKSWMGRGVGFIVQGLDQRDASINIFMGTKTHHHTIPKLFSINIFSNILPITYVILHK